MMPHLRECRAADARSGIIAENRSFPILTKFAEFSLADLNARSHAHSTLTLSVFSFLVGFFKVNCLDLALSGRRFGGNSGEETAAAASSAALSLSAHFFFCLFRVGNVRRRCGRSGTIDTVGENRLTVKSGSG
jgi:hypothetical protein